MVHLSVSYHVGPRPKQPFYPLHFARLAPTIQGWAFPFSLAATGGISVDFFSSPELYA
jgi:hypothetical protein